MVHVPSKLHQNSARSIKMCYEEVS